MLRSRKVAVYSTALRRNRSLQTDAGAGAFDCDDRRCVRGHFGTANRHPYDEAFAADRPVVLEVKTDPDVPPLPPHITLEQAKHLTHALYEGDPRQGGIIKETAKQLLASLVPE